MVNGDLLNQKDDHMLAREYGVIIGTIKGLLEVESIIEDYKAEREEKENADRL